MILIKQNSNDEHMFCHFIYLFITLLSMNLHHAFCLLFLTILEILISIPNNVMQCVFFTICF
jgi:hypothetical protein